MSTLRTQTAAKFPDDFQNKFYPWIDCATFLLIEWKEFRPNGPRVVCLWKYGVEKVNGWEASVSCVNLNNAKINRSGF